MSARMSKANLQSAITALEEKAAAYAAAIEELNKRTFELARQTETERTRREESDGKIFQLRQEAERRALITAGLETRLESLEQASASAPHKHKTDIMRRLEAAQPRHREDPHQRQIEDARTRQMNAEDKGRGEL